MDFQHIWYDVAYGGYAFVAPSTEAVWDELAQVLETGGKVLLV